MRRLVLLLALVACTPELPPVEGMEPPANRTSDDGTGTGTGADADGSTMEAPTELYAELSAGQKDVFDAINAERARNGLGAVALRADLVCAGAAHSADIGEIGACTHTGSDGSDPTTRLAACGGSSWAGEIVACGQGSGTQAVAGWLGRPGHRAVMLDPAQKYVGVGVHNNFWTAIFSH